MLRSVFSSGSANRVFCVPLRYSTLTARETLTLLRLLRGQKSGNGLRKEQGTGFRKEDTMWVMTTDSGLINLDFVAQIVVEKEWLKFYRLETPPQGIADKPFQDLVGSLHCGSDEKARQRLFDLEEQLNAHVKKSLDQRGREVPLERARLRS